MRAHWYSFIYCFVYSVFSLHKQVSAYGSCMCVKSFGTVHLLTHELFIFSPLIIFKWVCLVLHIFKFHGDNGTCRKCDEMLSLLDIISIRDWNYQNLISSCLITRGKITKFHSMIIFLVAFFLFPLSGCFILHGIIKKNWRKKSKVNGILFVLY